MPAHLKNEIGNTYGKLFVTRQAESRKGRSYWVDRIGYAFAPAEMKKKFQQML